jgi:hypothetical protein
MGNGEMLCGGCLGAGTKIVNSSSCGCDVCLGRGLVICINCKGDGRLTPMILQSKAVRDPEYASPDAVTSAAIDSP